MKVPRSLSSQSPEAPQWQALRCCVTLSAFVSQDEAHSPLPAEPLTAQPRLPRDVYLFDVS
jgi:hypothetical protein